MIFSLSESTSHFTLQFLMSSLWQGVVLIALVACFLRLMPRTNATTRYLILVSTLVVLICSSLITSMTSSNRAEVSASPVQPASDEIPVEGIQGGDDQVIRLEPNGIEPNGFNPQPIFYRPLLEVHGPLPQILLLAWILITSVMLIRILLASRYVYRLRRNSLELDEKFQAHLKRLLRRFPRIRSTMIYGSSEITMPMVIGPFRPAILIPANLINGLSDAEFEQIILHELAHVSRWDDWTKLIQRLAEAFFFFHPLVIWLGRKLNLERELACDDWVIYATGQSSRYAACMVKLLKLASSSPRPLLSTTLAMAEGQAYTRVKRLLESDRVFSPRLAKSRAGISIFALIFATLVCVKVSPIIAMPTEAQSLIEYTASESPAEFEKIQQPLTARQQTRRQTQASGKKDANHNQESKPNRAAPSDTGSSAERQGPDKQGAAGLGGKSVSRTAWAIRSAVAIRTARVSKRAYASVESGRRRVE